jgi:S-adenosylmethionine:tRNA ribosyltransferase-isomerase
MQLNDFDFNLPDNLIAQEPVLPRDHCRLLVLHRQTKSLEHDYFFNILNYFKKGDVLIINDSKVFPARLLGNKISGGKAEVFLLKIIELQTNKWQCLIKGRNLAPGSFITLAKNNRAELLKDNGDGTWLVQFYNSQNKLITYSAFIKLLSTIGEIPLPPYINRPEGKTEKADKKNYQTIYADEQKIGSVAAPTAGLHFTKTLLQKLKNKGVEIIKVTLHVGLGTFLPVKVINIKEHKMHSEFLEISKVNVKKILKAKLEDRRIIAVGTTSARTLETFGQYLKKEGIVFNQQGFKDKATKTDLEKKVFKYLNLGLNDFVAWTDIFIYPGYKFTLVDALITNFHLPKSTLLMLISAFVEQKNQGGGLKVIKKSYNEAVAKKYRFFSYGDAMLID